MMLHRNTAQHETKHGEPQGEAGGAARRYSLVFSYLMDTRLNIISDATQAGHLAVRFAWWRTSPKREVFIYCGVTITRLGGELSRAVGIQAPAFRIKPLHFDAGRALDPATHGRGEAYH